MAFSTLILYSAVATIPLELLLDELDEELDEELDDVLEEPEDELDMTACELLSLPHATKPKLSRASPAIFFIENMPAPYLTVTTSRATGFSQR